MGPSPAKFLSGFLLVSIALWFMFMFASRLLAWFLSRVLGASVGFRVGGWKCLRDIVIKFNKGAVESVSVGEIRLSLRQSLVMLGVGFISKEPKLQILICDLEVVIRSTKKTTQKTKQKKSRGPGRGKWMVLGNMARFLSISVGDLLIKTPKATVDIKELRVDISKNVGSESGLFIKLQLFPINVYPRSICDQLVNSGGSPCLLADGACSPFSCEEFSMLCELAHNRETGVVIQNLDVTSGDVLVNLNEDLLHKENGSSDSSSLSSSRGPSRKNESVSSENVKGKGAFSGLLKLASLLPEKASFTLPKFDVKFLHRACGLEVENKIMGIQLRCIKSRSVEDVGESTRLDVHMEFSEIYLLREAGISIVEIQKLDVVSSVIVPLQPNSHIRSEIDVKLGGTQCNLMLNRLEPWMRLRLHPKPKKDPPEEIPHKEKLKPIEQKTILWACTVSAPEMTVVLYSLTGFPLYHGCSQSSHLFSNNISSTGATLHMELGELSLHMSDEYHECVKDNLFAVESNSGSLMHIPKISFDLRKKGAGSAEEISKAKAVLSADVTGMAVCLSIRRIESLISTALSIKAFMKKLSASSNKPAQRKGMGSSRKSGKGIQLLKLNLEKCSVNFNGDVGLDNIVIPDPKRANYGSQGGRILVTDSADGTPRTAQIMSTISDEYRILKYSLSLDIFHFSFCLNKDKQSLQLELERARSMYQEYPEDNKPRTIVSLLDMHDAKLVRRSGGPKEIEVCSLFSATDISLRWEPDLHIALVELGLRLKSIVDSNKAQGYRDADGTVFMKGDEMKNEYEMDSVKLEKTLHKRESVFAIDVEMLTISAEVGDGVETFIQVQSIFSENAQIGVLLEGLMIHLNEARVFRSNRMQISRVPSALGSSSDAKGERISVWDWVIQALDVHICLPFRLQLRAIDDSVEEMLRALKLVTSAKTQSILPPKKAPSKLKKTSSNRTGCVKFCIHTLIADNEEEPLQGWLDEHYRLLKNEACELTVRLNFLDELIARSNQSPIASEPIDSELQTQNNNKKIDIQDASSIQKKRDEIHKRSFQSYYQACQGLSPSEGSGACKNSFQAGFRPSKSRTSLFSISATELDLSFTKIPGGDAGMIEVLQKLDPVCRAHNIPFSRLYGGNISMCTRTLVIQIRDYTYPIFASVDGRCEGRLILAQQATCFQPQVHQDIYIGRWRKVDILRSASGTTPPMKTFCDLPIHFQTGEVSYGVGFEPSFADISYAFVVALRRANLSIRNPKPMVQPPKKEKSLPWWDEMRNYIHGNITLYFSETKWNILGSTDPYEMLNKLQIVSGYMEIKQSDGRVYTSARDFKIFLNSLASLFKNTLKHFSGPSVPFIEVPAFTLEVTMDWDCESGNPLNHYLFALPKEGVLRDKVNDPFRSTSLSLRWNFSLRPYSSSSHDQVGTASSENSANDWPTMNLGHHDLVWLVRFWYLNYVPPHKLRVFSRWPRFGVPRVPRSGNLSLDRVMTEFMFRIDATPTCIRHMPLHDDDPAKGLIFKMSKLKYELCFSRGKQKYSFECKRESLDQVYKGLELHMPKVYIDKEDSTSIAKIIQMSRKKSQPSSMDRALSDKNNSSSKNVERHPDDGFLLSSEYFTIRRQTPKADPARLLAWQEAGRNLEMTYVRSEFENGSETDDHTRSDHSDDDGYNVVLADNCQRIFVYGLKLLWTLENRDAVWSWVGGISKAFSPSKPSPSRQYAQRKLLEKNALSKPEARKNDSQKPHSVVGDTAVSSQQTETRRPLSSPSKLENVENPFSGAIAKYHFDDSEEEGTRHFMVNVIEPQFNLHSEESNGRFLLAAVSGRVLARSFHSILHVGNQVIEQALAEGKIQPESQPEMTWNRMEFSVMLEHVQAHVAPTDVDPGAGLQWLPKIRRSSPKVKRTGALLERVFMPCDMYFRYTRHKGGTPELKVKPLKELTFNSHNITATMTSRQFQVMLDVLTNLLFARIPRPHRSNLTYFAEDDEDPEEEADEVVPDGVEEVELAKVDLEQKERVRRLILDDIKKLSLQSGISVDAHLEPELEFWMTDCARYSLVDRLKKELINAQRSRKTAAASLRGAFHTAAQIRLMEKEKNKSPSCAMRISLQINKVVWGMLLDGKSFAEAEINDMFYDFDRDYKDIGVAKFTTKYLVVRNCLPNAKSNMLLSPWNPPDDWGKKVMLRVDAKQGFSNDGNSPLELFQVEIYPLRIHLTEAMYKLMWQYLFPEEEQDSQRRQEVWKVSTTAGSRRVKKGTMVHETSTSISHSTKDTDGSKSSPYSANSSAVNQFNTLADSSSQGSKLQAVKSNVSPQPELRRTSSFDRTWEESVAESVANELVLQSVSSTKTSSMTNLEQQEDTSKNKMKEIKVTKPGRATNDAKKGGKVQDEKRSHPRTLREFHNIKISQVELLVTYEGSRFAVSDLRLLMDAFHRVEFTGTWRRLFSRVKKHIIWGVLKSVTGMQGKKFKDKAHSSNVAVPENDLNLSDSDGVSAEKTEQLPMAWPKRPGDGAGDGFVTSIRGLFNSQRRKAKAFVLRTMRGDAENELHGDWSESEAEFSPFARQLTITKAKRLIRRHTKKFRSGGHKGISMQQKECVLVSPLENTAYESDSSSESSPYEDFQE